MAELDRSLQFQFVLFFAPAAQPPRLRELPHAFAPTDDLPNWGLRSLATGREEQAVMFQPDVVGNLVQAIGMSWTGGAGIWRLAWGNNRLDLFLDVKGLAAVREEPPPTLLDVARVVSTRAAAVCDIVEQLPNRAGLLVTGESSCEGTSSSRVVADLYFNHELKSAAHNGELYDVVARVNRRTTASLADEQGARNVVLNRNETASSVFRASSPGAASVAALAMQWDVNTAPEEAVSLRMTPNQLTVFFKDAATWIEGRARSVGVVL